MLMVCYCPQLLCRPKVIIRQLIPSVCIYKNIFFRSILSTGLTLCSPLSSALSFERLEFSSNPVWPIVTDFTNQIGSISSFSVTEALGVPSLLPLHYSSMRYYLDFVLNFSTVTSAAYCDMKYFPAHIQIKIRKQTYERNFV